ncbi:MAG: hypothetical protein ABSG99_07640 [Sedimentisphaerales bacterium]
MKDTIKRIRPYSSRILWVCIFISVIATSYSFYKQIPNTDTKKEIRNHLKTINPKILQKIDEGEKEVHIIIRLPNLNKLKALQTYPSFNDFLFFQWVGDAPLDSIEDLDQNEQHERQYYYLYPRPALKEFVH